jgi:hypothetical protein
VQIYIGFFKKAKHFHNIIFYIHCAKILSW